MVLVEDSHLNISIVRNVISAMDTRPIVNRTGNITSEVFDLIKQVTHLKDIKTIKMIVFRLDLVVSAFNIPWHLSRNDSLDTNRLSHYSTTLGQSVFYLRFCFHLHNRISTNLAQIEKYCELVIVLI